MGLNDVIEMLSGGNRDRQLFIVQILDQNEQFAEIFQELLMAVEAQAKWGGQSGAERCRADEYRTLAEERRSELEALLIRLGAPDPG